MSGLLSALSELSDVTRAQLLAIWLDLKSRREEGWLRGRYPEYEAYRQRTRRFIPGAY